MTKVKIIIKQTQTIIERTSWMVTQELFDKLQADSENPIRILNNADWDDVDFVSNEQEENTTFNELT
tara:strand:+ start:371 stop:571 length:201 start_codon:yes stop_codon:yes gene_type:complete